MSRYSWKKTESYIGFHLSSLIPEESKIEYSDFFFKTDRPIIVCWFAPDQVHWKVASLVSISGEDSIYSSDGKIEVPVRALNPEKVTEKAVVHRTEYAISDREKPEDAEIETGIFFRDLEKIKIEYEILYKNMRVVLNLSGYNYKGKTRTLCATSNG